MFNQLKKILLNSGYQVILVNGHAKGNSGKSGGWARGAKGYILPDDLKIFINKQTGINDRVVTLIHELLHEIYPSNTEKQIDKESKQIFNGLTVNQLGFLQFFIMSPTESRHMLVANHLA